MKKIIYIIYFLFIWGVVASLSNPLFVPSPLSVIDAFISTIQSGMLLRSLLYSFCRISAATLLAAAASIPLALQISNHLLIRDVFQPVVNVMRYIPVTAFYPLLIMWFGIGEGMKVAFLFLASFVYMMPSTLLAFDDVDKRLIDTGITLGMRKSQITRLILLPAAAPSIAKTFLMMYGIGWTYIAVAETINAKYGLGFIISVSSARGQTQMVFMAIITIIIASVIFDKLGDKLIHKCFKWRFVNEQSCDEQRIDRV